MLRYSKNLARMERLQEQQPGRRCEPKTAATVIAMFSPRVDTIPSSHSISNVESRRSAFSTIATSRFNSTINNDDTVRCGEWSKIAAQRSGNAKKGVLTHNFSSQLVFLNIRFYNGSASSSWPLRL